MTILPRAATAPELAKIRSDNQSSRFYLTAHVPATIFTARLAAVPASTDRVSSITYNTGSGTHTDILPDMTMYIGTSAGAYDLGMVRIRNTTGIGAVTGTFNIGRVSEIDWQSNCYLTVVDEFAILPRWPETDSGGAVFMDTDVAYADQHRFCLSFPIFPRYAVKWLTGVSVNVIRDGSQSWALNNTINSYAWAAPGNSAISGDTTDTVTITYNAASPTAGYRVALTVGNTDGVSFTGYGRVFVLADEDDAITQFSVNSISGDYGDGGWSAEITCYAQADRATIRDRALIIIHRRDWYGLTAADEGSIGYVADDENIEMIGWIDGESIVWGTDDRYSTVTFRIYGPQFWLDKITMPTVGLKNLAHHPTNWKRFQGLTAKSATWHVLMWRTTAPRCIDCFPIENGWAALQLQSGGAQTVWQQLSNILSDFLMGAPCSDAYARLFLQREQQTLTAAERSAIPTVLSITKGDWSNEIDFERREVNQVAVVDLTGEIYNGTNTSTAVYSLSPGRVFAARGSSPFSRTRLIVDTQTTLNNIAAAIFGWQNNPYPDWRFKFQSNFHLIDIAPYQYLDIDIASADTPRAISATALRLIPRHIERIFHDGIIETEVTIEAESEIGLGITGDVPADPPEIPTNPPPPPPPPPPPVPTLDQNLAGGMMLVYDGSTHHLVYAGDVNAVSQPSWTELALPGNYTNPITASTRWDSNLYTTASGSRLILTGVKSGGGNDETIWECTNWASIKSSPTPPAPIWSERVVYDVTTIGGETIERIQTISQGQGAFRGDNIFYFVCKMNGTTYSVASIALDGSLAVSSASSSNNNIGVGSNVFNDLNNTGGISNLRNFSGTVLFSWTGNIFGGSEASSPYRNNVGGSAITAYYREAGATDFTAIRNSGGFIDLTTTAGTPIVWLGGNPLGTVVYATVESLTSAQISSDGGDTFGAFATWDFGKVIPVNATTDAGALWVLGTTVTSGNVPARIYDSAGNVLNDLTGNWWTDIFSGAASTKVLCARGWYNI